VGRRGRSHSLPRARLGSRSTYTRPPRSNLARLPETRERNRATACHYRALKLQGRQETPSRLRPATRSWRMPPAQETRPSSSKDGAVRRSRVAEKSGERQQRPPEEGTRNGHWHPHPLRNDRKLAELLENGRVAMHPFIVGEVVPRPDGSVRGIGSARPGQGATSASGLPRGHRGR